MFDRRPWVRAAYADEKCPTTATPQEASDLTHANGFLNHARGCDCSTCLLVARLRRLIIERDSVK